jgi:hypothetical protein
MATFDEYEIKARIVPAIIAVAPAVALALVVISFGTSVLSKTFSGVIVVGLLYAFGDLGRRLGSKIQPGIYKDAGGMPSTVMLRHRDQTFDADTKARYLGFLVGQVKAKVPSLDDERTDPNAADTVYARCGTWLRENTRDKKRFVLVFAENVTYGFRRNLYGLRLLGLAVNAVVVIMCAIYLHRGAWWGVDISVGNGVVFVLAVAVIHALYLLFFTTRADVIEAARKYGRQLILACEQLMPKRKAAAETRKKPA